MSLTTALHKACIRGSYPSKLKIFSQCARLPDSLSWSLVGRHDVYCGVYSSSGDLFFSGSHDGSIRIFDSSSLYLRLLEDIPCPYSYWSVVSLCLSPDERVLAYTILSNQVYLISLEKSGTRDRINLVGAPPEHGFITKTFSVCFDGTGSRLISGNDLGYIRMHDIEHGTCELLQVSSNKRDVNAVTTLDRSGHMFLTGSDDTSIRLFDSRALKKGSVAMFTGHMDGITYLDSKGDGVYFLSNSKDQTVRLWDLRKHHQSCKDQYCKPRAHWDYRVHSIPKTYLNPRHWQSGSSRGDQSVLTMRGHTVRYTLIRARFSPAHQTGQRYAYAGSTLNGWCIWDLNTGDLIRRNSHGPQAVRDVHWHPWDPIAVASELNGSLSCWKSSKTCSESDENACKERFRFEQCDPEGRYYRKPLEEAGLRYRFPGEIDTGPISSSSQSTLNELDQNDSEHGSSMDTCDSTLDTEYENMVLGCDWISSDESDPDFTTDLSDAQRSTYMTTEDNVASRVTRSQTRGRGRSTSRRNRNNT